MKDYMSKHHRKPRKLGGKSNKENISYVRVNKHEAWHILFGHRWPEDIARYINNVFLDPDYEFICVRKRSPDDPNQLKLPLTD